MSEAESLLEINSNLDLAKTPDRLSESEKLKPGEKQIVLVAGYQGGGKSAVARELSSRLHSESGPLRTDVIRKEAQEVGGFLHGLSDDEIYTPENKDKVYDEMFNRAVQLGESGSVVVDATFWDKASRDELQAKADAAEIPVRNVYVIAPDALAENWITKRAKEKQDASDAGIMHRRREARRFEAFDKPYIVVNNNGDENNLKQQVAMIVSGQENGWDKPSTNRKSMLHEGNVLEHGKLEEEKEYITKALSNNSAR